MQQLTLLQDEPATAKLPVRDLFSLKDSGIPGAELAMRDLDELHVQRLVNSDFTRWPAIKVTATTAGHLLIDGYHRQEAAIRKNEPLIPAVIQRYATLQDVVEAAFRANLFHGKQASEESRGNYAYWLYCTYKGISQEEIAARTGISQPAVSKAIAKREQLLRDAMLEAMGEGVKEQLQTERTCKQFTRQVIRFVSGVEAMNEEDLLHALQLSAKPQDREKLIRVGQLLVNAYK
jgi:transcriptional regulator with XRE-family HTH domain